MKYIHKLILIATICLPISGVGIARGAPGLMTDKGPAPTSQTLLKRVKTVPYVAAHNGKTSVAETWEGVVIIKSPTGKCIRTERSRLNFVRDGNGYVPEYEEYQRVVPCRTSSTANELWDSVAQAWRGDASSAKKP